MAIASGTSPGAPGEEGTFKLPKLEAEQKSVELRGSELAMILDGIDLASVKRVKRFRCATASA